MLFCAVSMQLQLVYGWMLVVMVIVLVVEVSSSTNGGNVDHVKMTRHGMTGDAGAVKYMTITEIL